MRHSWLLILLAFMLLSAPALSGQELEARVSVNRQQVQGSSDGVFDNLEKALTSLLNERQWTQLQFQRHERISCSFAITVSKYDESSHTMTATLTVQSTRPVYNSNYTTIVYSTKDSHFNFTFQEFDNLEFRPDVIDNDLTAMIAYYAYLIIGMDMDTMSPMGGTDVLQMAKTVCNNAQNLSVSSKGWKPFEDSKNRYAFINDYLDAGMQPFRELQYAYHRNGLDVMAENADRGRAGVSEALGKLKSSKKNKPMSLLPQMFTECKRDELVGIYQGKGTAKEKEEVAALLLSINPSYNSYWNKIKK